MKRNTILGIVSNEKFLIFLFYLFMTVCGFAAGTRIWSSGSISYNFNISFLRLDSFSNLFRVLFLPPIAVFVIAILMALFAGGWLFMPAVMYFVGAVGGYAGCCLFSDKVCIQSIEVLLAAFASYFCCFAVLAYTCVYSHALSRNLSCGDCRTAYGNYAKGVAASLVVIFITALVFSAVIYCLLLIG